ncbi:glycine oxidase ThiO [Sulfobacillus thermosulfidooxidans]|uniref:glycine oxidase ThiO n=1 Tax=Sulfobacillus thermosulfidooxidans TaxID=28034 RepID=UPI00040115D7|nr:glycine oxidase ThiO [Sulfobacillus thermosulfidooxidans]
MEEMQNSQDFIVVGAGIIGAMIAYRLVTHGYSVMLIDQGPPGGQASRAAAGILSPTAEAGSSVPFFDLLQASFLRYPALIEEIEEASQMHVDLHQTGVIQAALDDVEANRLHELYRWQKTKVAVEWVTSAQLKDLEPDMQHAVGALYAPHEMQVHGPKLVQALVRAGNHAGMVSRFGVMVQRFLTSKSGDVLGIETTKGQYRAQKAVIVAAGSWAQSILATLDEVRALPVKPIRGQILALTSDEVPIRHIVFAHHRYVVPKPDGRLILGATEDDAGFDDRVTADGVAQLAQSFHYFGPRVPQMHWQAIWAGLRPMAPDGLPVLGPWPGRQGLYVAAGHYRNGVLLSAITGDLVLNWAQNGTLPPPGFLPERFWRS